MSSLDKDCQNYATPSLSKSSMNILSKVCPHCVCALSLGRNSAGKKLAKKEGVAMCEHLLIGLVQTAVSKEWTLWKNVNTTQKLPWALHYLSGGHFWTARSETSLPGKWVGEWVREGVYAAASLYVKYWLVAWSELLARTIQHHTAALG